VLEIFPSEFFEVHPNVWIGATVENQERADERIPHLLRIPARVRFLSVEPMLGPITFKIHHWPIHWVIAGGESGVGFRTSDPAWFRGLRNQCINAGVPFFFKQWGGLHSKINGAELDGREWKEFPA
jgi:protein gp37